MVIKMRLSDRGIADAIKQLKAAKKRLEKAQDEIVERLAEYGALRASLYFSVAQMNADDVRPVLNVEIDRSAKKATIYANSVDVGFIEFGAGSRFAGTTHPQNAEFGTGPGTWSTSSVGKGRWLDPKGWHYRRGGTTRHSYGQPPAMAMYKASLDIQEETERIVREVLGG